LEDKQNSILFNFNLVRFLKISAMPYSYFIPGVFFCFCAIVPELSLAQECDEDISDKAVKLVEKAKDRKKYDKAKRIVFLRDALEEEEAYAEANYMLAIETIKTQRSKGGGYSTVIKYLEQVKANCPDFHSDVYYYLGAIYLGQKKYALAVENQQLFLDFTSDDENKFSKKYEQYLVETEEDLKYAKFFAEAYAHPVPFNPTVVRDVSTNEGDEYLPLLTPDNEKLYFTRRWEDKTPNRNSVVNNSHEVRYIEKFSVSGLDAGKFIRGDEMPEPFNADKKSNYGGVTISLNNRHLYVTICKPYFDKQKQAYLYNCDIYQSDYIFGFNKLKGIEEWYWTEPENCGPNINTPKGWESQPSLSADGRHLYFASIREGSQGIDIYRSDKTEEGWGMAKNVGPPINTAYNDKSPFVHTDSKTLYFSSQGHLGFGGFDIFYARQNNDGTWNEPINIGHPINTDEDEHGFVVSTDGSKVYYSSARIGNVRTRLNILSFDLYKEARPENVVFVKGKVDQSEASATNKRVKIENLNSKKVTEFEVDETDGAFAAVVVVKPGDKVVLKVEGEDVAYNARLIDVPDSLPDNKKTAKLEPIAQEINVVAKSEKVGGAYRLDDIHYETNSADISDRSKVIVDDFGKYLLEKPNIKVAIHGHTDNVGIETENLVLSTDRAYSVKAYLEEMGVSSARLQFKGFGSSKPIASNATEEGKIQNRRTEFVLLSK